MIHEFPPILDCWYLTGATASGKSAVSLALAEHLDAEIVSMDSMAVYRGMDIGTAKPNLAAREKVPHHLIDVVDPSEEYSLAEYLAAAHAAVADIKSRKRRVLFVGGTPLYLKSMLRGVCEGPPADPDFRREVEAEVEQVGVEALRQRLAQVDPLSAAKLHTNDMRRMIRALEVYKLTGFPISHYQTQFEGKYAQRCKNVFVVSRERSVLHERIAKRTTSFYERGLVDEVSGLLERYGQFSKTALQGVGYQEALNMIQKGTDLEVSIEETKIRTRRYARRQETWFRGLSECKWIAVDHLESTDQILQVICQEAG